MSTIKELLLNLNIVANDLSLYEQAFTHKSYHHVRPNKPHYEMLEFLGDSLLNLQTSLYIFKNIDAKNEGNATILRSQIVSSVSFAKISDKLQLSKYLKVAKGSEEILNNTKIKADILESLTAAIYLDQDKKTFEDFVKKILHSLVKKQSKKVIKDPKSEFQEIIQSFSKSSIKYITKKTDKFFESELIWDNKIYWHGKGNSIKEAELEAAKKSLKKLKKEFDLEK
ncbi:ribonuclease III [Mesomycoplasma hyorhinis]|uniref:ribonuclease III n=1 Tax=Mesomycoplasma hyorhinis TaxID=2100 RepID=UPI001C042BB9|nr:ribonuclease III [Mesomycoplasma hyorhinis]